MHGRRFVPPPMPRALGDATQNTWYDNERRKRQMKNVPILVAACGALFFSSTPVLAGVSEINEGTVRRVYIEKPLVGAKGYVVGDWERGQVRVEVKGFPESSTGYEVFLFEIDVPA
jgi:hypothetical protein